MLTDESSDVIASVIGRDPELSRFEELMSSANLYALLSGAPGIGKTTLWQAACGIARGQGRMVLAARPSATEARLPFAGLIDLFDPIDTESLQTLPPPQRRALEVALLRAEPTDGAAEPAAIALGLRGALRELAETRRVVIAIDDVQWLDPPTADALTFAARRLADASVGFILAKRPGPPTELEQALVIHEPERLEVGPLSLGAVRRMLSERLGLTVSRPLLRRIHDATVGNPLFALEIGRALVEQGVPQAGEDIPAPDAVEDMLGTRLRRLSAPVRRLVLAAAMTPDPRAEELAALGGVSAVEDALDAGVLVLDGDRLRPSHPLLAAAARKRSQPRERRELHRRLAEVVGEEALRALHLALSTDTPDETLAQRLSLAATAAFARGARQQAVQLAEHGLRLTPAASGTRSRRVLALAEYLYKAGELNRLGELLSAELESLPAGPSRARGWLLLSEAQATSLEELERYVGQALAESGDDHQLRAYLLAKKADNAAAAEICRIPEAEAWAAAALADAEDRDTERFVLYALSWARAMAGKPLDEQCRRSGVMSDPAGYISACAERVAAQRHIWRGELESARALLEELRALTDSRGELASYGLIRLHLCELALRAGDWNSTARLLDEWDQTAERDLQFRPMYERCRSLLAAGRGDVADARDAAAAAILRARETGCRWDELEARRARGIAAMLAGEPQAAVDDLTIVWEHTQREGVLEPGVFPVGAELVEALTELADGPDAGELALARAVSERVHELAEAQQHPWALPAGRRSGALVRLASGAYDPAAVATLTQAAADFADAGLRFEHARTLLSLGRALRRHKQWGAARDTLEAAIDAFEALGSPGWAQSARAELGRVGGRGRRQSDGLTPTERRVADLAAEGLSNKQIAQALYVTVHTIEVHLSRTYAKLEVRSRAQLAGRLARLSATASTRDR